MSDEAQTQEVGTQAPPTENQTANTQAQPIAVTETDPNAGAASAAAAPVADTQSSAISAPGEGGESNSGENSGAGADDPLHVQIAQHLEAIYQLARNSVENPVASAEQLAADLKEHIGDVLHSIRNGVAVAEGQLVAKLEKLVSML